MTDYSKKEQEPSAEPVDYAKADAWAAEPILQPRPDEEHAEWLPSYVVNAARAYLALRTEVERERKLRRELQEALLGVMRPADAGKDVANMRFKADAFAMSDTSNTTTHRNTGETMDVLFGHAVLPKRGENMTGVIADSFEAVCAENDVLRGLFLFADGELIPKLAKCGCRFAVRYGLRRIDHRAECPKRRKP